MKVKLKMANSMEKVNIYTKMEIIMKVNGKMEKKTDLEYSRITEISLMKANGKTE